MATTPNSVITPQTPNITVGQTLTTANTAQDGTGSVVTLFTAGADGGKVDAVRVAYTGSTVQTVLKLFINNGSTNTTAANNALLTSIIIPANTMTSQISSAADIYTPIGITLPGNWKLMACIGVTIANPISVIATGGNL